MAPARRSRRLYILPRLIFLSSFFVSYPRISPRGTQPNFFHMLRSEPDLKMHVQNLGCPSPKMSGPKTTYYGRLSTTSQANGDFGINEDIDKWKTALKTTKVLTFVQNFMNVGPRTAKNRTFIIPALRKCCILLFARLRSRRSTNASQPNFARR